MLAPYSIRAADTQGSRAERFPGRAVSDHGIAGIIAACDDPDQIDRACETTSVLYPPLVLGIACIPTIVN